MRASGILMPVSSLASKYGIGCFSKEAYEFIDFLKESGQTYWQILPFGPTGYGDSPYQCVSAFAGNPYFIDLETLKEEGLVEQWFLDERYFGTNPEYVDYGAQYNNRFLVLKMAFDAFRERGLQNSLEYQTFFKKEAYWLEDYALFMSIKRKMDQKSWQQWDLPLRTRDTVAIHVIKEELKELIEFFYFQQFEFYKQWNKLHAYAKKQGIKIIGDMPFYPAMDSVDAWSHPELFLFDKKGEPEYVAGCGPDAFSATGQLWGNPIYNWESMKKNAYQWWITRFEHMHQLCDVIRIDHFHGFAQYYAIPYGDKTAENGTLHEGPGMELFKVLEQKVKNIQIIAEDLGASSKYTEKMMKNCPYPGMRILQFAYDGSETSSYLPYFHEKNCVVYTGTHDNMTSLQWIESINDHDRDFVRRYIHSENTNYGAFVWDFIREAYRSTADTCIIPLQDYLVMGKEARINEPGTLGTNWQWRLKPSFLSKELAHSIYQLTKLYGRLPKKEKAEGNE